MKTLISSFENSVLSREQMKSVKGGISCKTTYYLGNGQTYSSWGECGSDDIAECESYQPACSGMTCSNDGCKGGVF